MKAGFYMVVKVAEKQKVQRLLRTYGNHSPEIVPIVAMANIPECSGSMFDPDVSGPDHSGQSFCSTFLK